MGKLCLTVYFIVIFIGYHSKQEGDSIIYWDQRNKLLFEDFNVVDDTLMYVTQAKSWIGLEDDANSDGEQLVYQVRAFFDREKSTVTGTMDLKLLEHENLHFDLAELQARKIKMVISDLNCPTRERIDSVFSIYSDSLASLQHQYDIETAYSLNDSAQNQWLNRTKLKLDSLDFYSASVVNKVLCK